MTDTGHDRRQRSSSAKRRLALELVLLGVLIAAVWAQPSWRRAAWDSASAAATWSAHELLGWSDRQLYMQRLTLAGLADAPAVRAWDEAPETARAQSALGRAPLRLEFSATETRAGVYTLDVAPGQTIAWRLTPRAGAGPVFASLKQRSGADDDWHYRASITADDQIHSLDVDQPARYRFVIQPRLFEAFAGTLQVRLGGQLGMPVVGAHAYDIGGGFGAARDGGARRHQGVDIFADASTPVTAVVDGRVHQRSGGLGGQAIFLSAGLTGPRYYYAHLSAFTTADGARVKVGDVIGRVGATGNAAGGAPHLHFGIYSLGGAVDPAPYIRPRPDLSRPD